MNFDCAAAVAGGAMAIMPVRTRTILDIVAVVILLAAALYLGLHYAALPQDVQTHINGLPPHYRNKQAVWLPIGIGAWSIALLSFASWVIKDGTPMDARPRTSEQIEALRISFSMMKVVVACVAAYYSWIAVQPGMSGQGKSPWPIVCFFVGLACPVVTMIVQERRRVLVG